MAKRDGKVPATSPKRLSRLTRKPLSPKLRAHGVIYFDVFGALILLAVWEVQGTRLGFVLGLLGCRGLGFRVF